MKSKILTDITIFNTSGESRRHIALWDTGATETLISKKIVDELSLNEAGTVEIVTMHGSQLVKRYHCAIKLEGHTKVINIAPALFSHRKECDVIIGMDIIGRGLFILDNGNFSFVLNSAL